LTYNLDNRRTIHEVSTRELVDMDTFEIHDDLWDFETSEYVTLKWGHLREIAAKEGLRPHQKCHPPIKNVDTF